MPHLRTFSRLHHARFGEYNKGLTGGQPYIIDDNGNNRQIEIDDLYNPQLNYHFSDQTVERDIQGQLITGGRRISFMPKAYNSSKEFQDNIGQYVDLTGISVIPKIFDSFNYPSIGWSFFSTDTVTSEYNEPDRKGVYNFDNYNPFLRWQGILLTPRHIIACGHCYSLTCETISQDQAFNLVLTVSVFMGKNDVIYRPFSTLQSVRDAYANGNLKLTFCKPPSYLCGTCPPGMKFLLIELPDDDWIDTTQVKYYNKLAVNNFIPKLYPSYLVRAAGHTICPVMYPTQSYPIGDINSLTNSFWTGDSFSALLLNYNNDTVLANITDEEIYFTEDFINYLNQNIKNTGYNITPIYIASESTYNPADTFSYFNLSEDFIFNNDSKFKQHELLNKNIKNIGFIPGVQLQAQELNELQDLFTSQLTYSNSYMGDLIINNIKNNGTLLKKISQNSNPSVVLKEKYIREYSPTRRQGDHEGLYCCKQDNGLLFYDYNIFTFNIDEGFSVIFINFETNLEYQYYSDELSFYLTDSANRVNIPYQMIPDFQTSNIKIQLCNFFYIENNVYYTNEGLRFDLVNNS